MSTEQQQQEHPLDKRKRALSSENSAFTSTNPQDQVFKEISELRLALLASYNQHDFVLAQQALETKTAKLYEELDASTTFLSSVLRIFSGPEVAQQERLAKIEALRTNIEEDKKVIQQYLNLPAEERLAYLIGQAAQLSPDDDAEDYDAMMEIEHEIDNVYDEILPKYRNTKAQYTINGQTQETTAEMMYQNFRINMLKRGSALNTNNENEDQSEEIQENFSNPSPLEERVDEHEEVARETQGKYNDAIKLYTKLVGDQIIAINAHDRDQIRKLGAEIKQCEESIDKTVKEYEAHLSHYDFEYQLSDGQRELEKNARDDVLKLNAALAQREQAVKQYEETYSVKNPLYQDPDISSEQRYAKPLPPTPPKPLKAQVPTNPLSVDSALSGTQPLSEREQMLKKLDEKLKEIDIKMRTLTTSLSKKTKAEDIDQIAAFYHEAELELQLYSKVKEFAKATTADREKIQEEIFKLVDKLRDHMTQNSEIYAGALAEITDGTENTTAAQIKNEIAKLRQDVNNYLKLEPVESIQKIDEGLGKPLPPTPKKPSALMAQIKKIPVPPAPLAVVPPEPKSQIDVPGQQRVLDAQKKQANEILQKLPELKEELLNNQRTKITIEEATRLQQAIKPLLEFLRVNHGNENLKTELNKIRGEVAEMKKGIEQYLDSTAGLDRKLLRAASTIKKVVTQDETLSSRDIIKETKNEIQKVTSEAPKSFVMRRP